VSPTVAHTTEHGHVSEANSCSATQEISFNSDVKDQQTLNELGKLH
jgi:hypothetical protein